MRDNNQSFETPFRREYPVAMFTEEELAAARRYEGRNKVVATLNEKGLRARLEFTRMTGQTGLPWQVKVVSDK